MTKQFYLHMHLKTVYICTKTRARVITAALPMEDRNGKQPKCRIDKKNIMHYIHTTWMNLTDIMLNKRVLLYDAIEIEREKNR